MATFFERRTLGWCCASVALSAVASAGGVRILDRPSLPPFGDIQGAVDHAIDGETLLVAPGTYSGFVVDSRTLAIVAVGNAPVDIQGTVEIDNVALGQWVVLVGMNVTGASRPAPQRSDPALRLNDNLGNLRLQDCQFHGGLGLLDPDNINFVTHGAGGHSVVAVNAQRVSFANCDLFGGNGGSQASGNYQSVGGGGGRGLDSTQSRVVLYDSSLRGGRGGSAGNQGGSGGDACHVLGLFMIAANSSFIGGSGGDAWDFLPYAAGDGGAGVYVESATQARLFASSKSGGAGGTCWGCSSNGANGAPSAGPGTSNTIAGTARKFSAATVTREKSIWNVTFSGVPGDRIVIEYATSAAFGIPALPAGALLVPFGSPVIRVAGVVPASGTLVVPVRTGSIAGQGSGSFSFLQGMVTDTSGALWYGSPMQRVTFNIDGLSDCNGNALQDVLEVVQGLAPDADHDLVPDSCDPDCNGNGVIDGLDIASGASLDVDHDLVPDSCESPRTWYVDDSAAQGGDGSAAAPFRAIAPAVHASLSGDTILIADGTYTGSGNRDISFGGRVLTVQSQNGAATTIVDCEHLGRAFVLTHGEGPGTQIRGLTIRNGTSHDSDPNDPRGGGGIFAGVGTTLELVDCVVEGCATGFYGAGLFIASGRVERCTLRSNVAQGSVSLPASGGGAFCAVQVVLLECLIEDNSATTGGGLSAAFGPDIRIAIERCRIRANTVTGHGGGIYYRSGGPLTHLLVYDSSISGNSAPEGGGLYASKYLSVDPDVIEFRGCTIFGNTATTRGSGMLLGERSDAFVANSIVRGNPSPSGRQAFVNGSTIDPVAVLTVEQSDWQGGQAGVTVGVNGTLNWNAGNFDADPLFVAGDFRLSPTSPCIDRGNNSLIGPDIADADNDGNLVEASPFDLDGSARRTDSPTVADLGVGSAPLVDVGCYEWHP